MWRRGAPQRRGARGAFRGADAHTRCYAMLCEGIMTKQRTNATWSAIPIPLVPLPNCKDRSIDEE
jgi:hypothetical protein